MAASTIRIPPITMKFIMASLLLLQCHLAHSYGQNRFIIRNPTRSPLISDGLHETNTFRTSDLPKASVKIPEYVGSNSYSESSCEQTYGVLPCTDSVIGNLFLLGVYGFFMFKSASLLSDGSEMLLEVMGPGVIGGLLLPILGALPDTLLIFVSGISGTKETAQSQVLIGMGLLSGSTVMLLTALWGSCLVVGKCDLSAASETIDSQDTKKFDLCGSGVTVDKSTRKASYIMMATIIPFIIAQIPLIFGIKSAKHASVLIACIVAFVSLLGYCVFQIMQPWIQKRRLAFLKHRHIMSSILAQQQKRHGALIKDSGEPNVEVIHKVFESLDEDHDGRLTKGELRGLIVGLEIDDPERSVAQHVDKIMADFDVDIDGHLSLKEFTDGVSKWIRMATSAVGQTNQDAIASEFHMKSKEELEASMDDEEESPKVVDNKLKVYLKAGSLLLLGAVIAGVFADPLVDAVDEFSDVTNIPSFFISFIAMPFATNSSEAISAVIFASRKRKRTASLTYSEIYGAVTMNNTLCLGVFLALVYIRGLDWDFSAEVLVILVAVIVTGIMGSTCTTYKLWMCFIAFLMYPLSLVLVYVLDYQFGWT